MSEIYIVKDKKRECIIGIFDKEHVKPFLDSEDVLVGDKFFLGAFLFAKEGFTIYGFDINKEYAYTDVNTIESSGEK